MTTFEPIGDVHTEKTDTEAARVNTAQADNAPAHHLSPDSIREALRLPSVDKSKTGEGGETTNEESTAEAADALKESLRTQLRDLDIKLFTTQDGRGITEHDDAKKSGERKILLEIYRAVGALTQAEQQKLNALLQSNPDNQQFNEGVSELLKSARERLPRDMESLQSDITDLEILVKENTLKDPSEKNARIQQLYDRLNRLEQLNNGGNTNMDGKSEGVLSTKGSYDRALDAAARQRLQNLRFSSS